MSVRTSSERFNWKGKNCPECRQHLESLTEQKEHKNIVWAPASIALCSRLWTWCNQLPHVPATMMDSSPSNHELQQWEKWLMHCLTLLHSRVTTGMLFTGTEQNMLAGALAQSNDHNAPTLHVCISPHICEYVCAYGMHMLLCRHSFTAYAGHGLFHARNPNSCLWHWLA